MAEAAIKTIKIRNSDGTYNDSLPIGADDANITVLADNSILSDVLGPVNVAQKGSIQEQLDNLLIIVNNLKLRIETLEKNLPPQ